MPDLAGIECVHQIRLPEIGGHLCQHLAVGYAHIHGEAQFLPDPVLDHMSGLFRGRILSADRRIIHITLVHTDLLEIRAEIRQKCHKFPAPAAVQLMIRRLQRQPGAFAQCIDDGFSGHDAVSFGRNGLRQHNAVSFGHISADDGRDRAQIHIRSVMQLLQCAPA